MVVASALVAFTLVEPTLTTLPLQLLNPHAESMTVYTGTCMTLATLEEMEPPTTAVDVISSGDPTVTIGVEKRR